VQLAISDAYQGLKAAVMALAVIASFDPKSFERRLQTLYARLKDLYLALRTNVRWRHLQACAWHLAAIASDSQW